MIGLYSSVIKKYYLSISLFLGVSLLFFPPAHANWVSALKEIYETPIPAQIRKDFDQAVEIRERCSECMLGVFDGDQFMDVFPRKFLVLSLLPNSFGDVCAFIAVEGGKKNTYRLWLDRLPGGEYDLRSVEELPNSMDEEFFGQLQDPAHRPYWK